MGGFHGGDGLKGCFEGFIGFGAGGEYFSEFEKIIGHSPGGNDGWYGNGNEKKKANVGSKTTIHYLLFNIL